MIWNDNDFGPDALGQPPWERMMQDERAFAALQDPASWLAAQNALSGLLAQAAAAVARADALLAADRAGGLAERMAVEGAAAIAWHALSRIAPDELALYLHGAAPARPTTWRRAICSSQAPWRGTCAAPAQARGAAARPRHGAYRPGGAR
jgi:hypothetical protein